MLTDTAATGAAPQARVEPRPVICRGIKDTTGKMDRILPAKIKLLEKTIKLQAVTYMQAPTACKRHAAALALAFEIVSSGF